jgi:hypothetical protein
VTDEPMPRDFGWRYIGWFLWCNALTLLGTAQGTFAVLALANDMFSPRTLKTYLIANAVLSVVVSQIKKNFPPPPAPLKDPTKT